VEYYTPSNTAFNALMPGPSDADFRSVRVYYTSDNQPFFLFAPVPARRSSARKPVPQLPYRPRGARTSRAVLRSRRSTRRPCGSWPS